MTHKPYSIDTIKIQFYAQIQIDHNKQYMWYQMKEGSVNHPLNLF